MSYKPKSHIFCLEMVKSENYVNKNGEHPEVNSLIKWNRIVFNEKDIVGDEWYFCNVDGSVVINAHKQWEDLKLFDDDIFILEKK